VVGYYGALIIIVQSVCILAIVTLLEQLGAKVDGLVEADKMRRR